MDAHAHGGAAAKQDATARPETNTATAKNSTPTGGRSESTAAQLEHALAVALAARHAPSPPAQLALVPQHQVVPFRVHHASVLVCAPQARQTAQIYAAQLPATGVVDTCPSHGTQLGG